MKPTDCICLKRMPLGDRGIFKSIEMNYIEVPDGKNSMTLDVSSYI